MFTNFFNNNKGRIVGNLATGGNPAGALAGGIYDAYSRYRGNATQRRNNRAIQNGLAIDEIGVDGKLQTTYREKENPYDFGMSYAPAKATYNSDLAYDKVSEAKASLDEFKARTNSQGPTYDPYANIGQLENKSKKDDDDEEDDGPSLIERYLRDVQRIQEGNFKYSATEKANLENLRRTGRQAELRQSRVNDNYMGGTLQGELRSGRSRYAQEIADDAMINAMQKGTDAINENDLQTQKIVSELEQDIKEERLRQVAEKYGLLQEQDRQRNDRIQELQQNILDYQKFQAEVLNAERDYKYKYDNLAYQRSRDSANRANALTIAGLGNSYYGGSSGTGRVGNATII